MCPTQVDDEVFIYDFRRILLKHPNSPLKSDHGENWYEVNVWGPIIDHLFLIAAESFEVDRYVPTI